MPANLDDPTDELLLFSTRYWAGFGGPGTWDALLAITAGDHDVGLLPDRSGLVVLDCDVKVYEPETGFVMLGERTATLAAPVVKHGISDLQREVEKLGHTMAELATYTVLTKSGGYHLYFQRNERHPLRMTGHRHDWRVDVVAGNDLANRSWVAAPPTPGYTVARDLPVAPLPDWLAAWLSGVRDHLLPPGGRQRRLVSDLERAARSAVNGGSGLPAGDGLFARWVQMRLNLVALANQHGGWNLEIYQAARDLMNVGLPQESIIDAIIAAAKPTSDLERRKALDTIRSAARDH
jgi:hypothetical protein